MPSVTCTVCPTACAGQALRAPGETHHLDPHPGRRLARRDHVEPGVPVSVSAGAFTVGCCFIISNGLLLAGAREQGGQSWPGPPPWLAAQSPPAR